MSLQIVALIVVVLGFSGLLMWVYSPSNKARFDAGAMLAVDDQSPDQAGNHDE